MFNVGKFGQEKQIEFIVKEADIIWQKVKTANIIATDFKATDDYFKLLRIEHPDFAKTLPLVMRVMVQTRQYNSKALERYLKKLSIDMKKWKSMDDYIESQADYMVYLYKATHNHYSPKDTIAVRKHNAEMLKKENDDMKKYSEEVQIEAEEQQKKISEERRKVLYDMIMDKKKQNAGEI